jgi:hypothetical protein
VVTIAVPGDDGAVEEDATAVEDETGDAEQRPDE